MMQKVWKTLANNVFELKTVFKYYIRSSFTENTNNIEQYFDHQIGDTYATKISCKNCP